MNPLIKALVSESDDTILAEAIRLTEATPEQWAGMYNPADWELDPDMLDSTLRQVGSRFKDERTQGFAHPTKGPQPAVSPDEAESRWQAAEPAFRKVLSKFDPKAVKRFRMWRQKKPAAAAGAPAVCPHCGK
jgi:hypothetical protein